MTQEEPTFEWCAVEPLGIGHEIERIRWILLYTQVVTMDSVQDKSFPLTNVSKRCSPVSLLLWIDVLG